MGRGGARLGAPERRADRVERRRVPAGGEHRRARQVKLRIGRVEPQRDVELGEGARGIAPLRQRAGEGVPRQRLGARRGQRDRAAVLRLGRAAEAGLVEQRAQLEPIVRRVRHHLRPLRVAEPERREAAGQIGQQRRVARDRAPGRAERNREERLALAQGERGERAVEIGIVRLQRDRPAQRGDRRRLARRGRRLVDRRGTGMRPAERVVKEGVGGPGAKGGGEVEDGAVEEGSASRRRSAQVESTRPSSV